MHPCLTCGACCAMFRVGFHWSEAAPELGGTVPPALTEVLDAHRVVMKGTWASKPRCVALDADIGRYSRCTIHPVRPSVCREVPASWEFGEASPQCDKARIAFGLPALTPADWPQVAAEAGAANDPLGVDHDDDPPSPRLPPMAA
ncbi:YkgJ family cysteine cluster protein [Coralloluteibacterium thermophilus]|uniref:YkgJ family cysteine cluster protein n=1 Tax=Coralloluteibacterium thermophilum TaxID=2707049 RepID=A0ABV9NP48_9GAMM